MLRFKIATIILLLAINCACGFGQNAASAELAVNAGELRLDGQINAVDAAKKILLIDVVSFTTAGGKTSRLAEPKSKIVVLNEQTTLHVRGNAGQAIALADLQAGLDVAIVGKDLGSGQQLPAREVALGAAASLTQSRKAHTTKLLQHTPAPQAFSNRKPEGAQQISFESAGRKLLAYLAVPDGPGPYPAVLYAHGGFSLGAGDFEDAKAFVQAGFAVLVPAWRGENGNGGDFEMLFGEVDDASAALDYLAKVPGVDANRVFAAGHSMGGTTVMLLAELSPRLRKVAACGGFPDMQGFIARNQQPLMKQTPFDWSDPTESFLRSPARHVQDLQCPLALFYGEDEKLYRDQAAQMARHAHVFGKDVRVFTIPGADHHSALRPAIEQMIGFFKDEGTLQNKQ